MAQISMPIQGVLDGGGGAPGQGATSAPADGVLGGFGEILAGIEEWQADGEGLLSLGLAPEPESPPEAAPPLPGEADDHFDDHAELQPETSQPSSLLAGFQVPFDGPSQPLELPGDALIDDDVVTLPPGPDLQADGQAAPATMQAGPDTETLPRADRPAEPIMPPQRPPAQEAERPLRPTAGGERAIGLAEPQPAQGERTGVTAEAGRRPAPDLIQALMSGERERGQPPQPAVSPELVASQFHQLQELGAESDGRPRLAMASVPPQGDLAQPLPNAPAVRAAVPAIAVEIAARVRDGARQFTIQLDPPELGRIDVRLDIARDGVMSAKLVVDRPETLDLLVRDARVLEKTLQASGLKLEEGGLQYQLRDQSGFAGHDRGGADAERRADGGEAEDGNGRGSIAGDDGGARRMSLGGVDIRV